MERQPRVILISAVISAVLGLTTGFLGGRLAAPPAPVAAPAAEAGAVMQAQDFQLVDQAGRVRGRLGVDAHGAARLTLFGPDGTLPRVSLAATPQGGAELELGDGQHQNAVGLKADQDARNIALYHEGKLRLGLEVQKNGEAAVNLYDKGNRLMSLGAHQPGRPASHLLRGRPQGRPGDGQQEERRPQSQSVGQKRHAPGGAGVEERPESRPRVV